MYHNPPNCKTYFCSNRIFSNNICAVNLSKTQIVYSFIREDSYIKIQSNQTQSSGIIVTSRPH